MLGTPRQTSNRRSGSQMVFQQATEDVLRAVEEATGRPVAVRADASLGTLLAKLTMARGPAPAHLITYNPMAGAVDYVICSQCGRSLRHRQFAVQHLLRPRRNHCACLVGRHEFERVDSRRQIEQFPTAGPE